MSWETFEPDFVQLMTDFLAKVAKSVVMLRLGPTGEILEANPAFEELFPTWTGEENRTLQALMAPSEKMEDGTPSLPLVTYRLQGSVVPGAQIRGLRVPVGEGSVLIGERLLPASVAALNLLTSTTNELARLNRELQKKFRESQRAQHHLESRYKLLVENTSDGIIQFNKDSHVEYVSPAYIKQLGYSEQEELQRTPEDIQKIIHPEDQDRVFLNIYNAINVKQNSTSYSYRAKHKNGRYIWREDNATLNYDNNGNYSGAYVVCRDISERKRLEAETLQLQAQLAQSQKMESLGALAGGVAHDMNNVLGAILGMATANSATQPVDSPVYRAFETITQAAERGGQMVRSLLNFARQSPTEERELDLNAILREEVKLLERTTLAKVRLELDLAPSLRPIRGDGAALTHAFMNLCVNAVDAMPDNGRLTLRTRNTDHDWSEVIVEDTGTGMPKEVLEKALDPFFTTKAIGKGTGLGLSMVHSTIMAHKGQMEIQSEPGQGTRVKVRFPACEVPAPTHEPVAEPRIEPTTGGLSVLLVDDDALIQNSMRAIMEVLGHNVTAVLCGEEALAKLEGGLNPDVVILDMNMPGLGGPGTLPRLRALNPTVPVLLATGRVDQFATEVAGAHPFVTLLSKPFGMRELQQRLGQLVRG